MAVLDHCVASLCMSTEHQQYSLENALTAIRNWADLHSFDRKYVLGMQAPRSMAGRAATLQLLPSVLPETPY